MRIQVLQWVAAIMLTTVFGTAAWASETQFYGKVEGQWSGPGEIVAGKFKGTKFNCVFNGIKPDRKIGIAIDGNCRIGVFSQPINASVVKASGVYSGQFMDGEAGEGMDIIGGRYEGSKLQVKIRRKDLRGVMVANLTEQDRLNVTISVRVQNQLIPVIGMTLKRIGEAVDRTSTSSIK